MSIICEEINVSNRVKNCIRCKIEKYLSEFPLREGARDGRRKTCKSCYSSQNAKRHCKSKYKTVTIKSNIKTNKIKNDGCCFKEEAEDILVKDEKINGIWYRIIPSKAQVKLSKYNTFTKTNKDYAHTPVFNRESSQG